MRTFSQNGQVLALATTGSETANASIETWNMANTPNKSLGVIDLGQNAWLNVIALNEGGTMLAGALNGHIIKVWSTGNRQELVSTELSTPFANLAVNNALEDIVTLKLQATSDVNQIRLANRAKVLFTARQDGTIAFWYIK